MNNHCKIAILLMCHTLPKQINDFIAEFQEEDYDFYIHIDKKASIQDDITKNDNVFFIDDINRVNVQWGGYSQVEASLSLLKTAFNNDKYLYYWLCSGQDYPIKSTAEITSVLKKSDCNYIHVIKDNTKYQKRVDINYPSWMIGRSLPQKILKTLYIYVTGGRTETLPLFKKRRPKEVNVQFGSSWWCLNEPTVQWLLQYIKCNPEFIQFFKRTLCPDESFYQTLVMTSPYRDYVKDNLVYVDWSENNNSPKTLTREDWPLLQKSGKLIARKIDSTVDPAFYEQLKSQIRSDRTIV